MANAHADRISSRLVRSFAVIGAGVMVAVVLFMGTIQYYLTDQEIGYKAERNSEAFAATLATLVADKIDRMLATQGELVERDSARQSAFAVLNDVFSRQGANGFVLKVNIFDPTGYVVYSTSSAQIGAERTDLSNEELDNPAFQEVLRNRRPAGERNFLPSFDAIGGEVMDRYVQSNYLPLFAANDRRLIGVFEIYSDVTGEVNNLNRMLAIELGGALLLIGAAYAALMTTVWQGAQAIDRAHAEKLELAAAMAELNAASQAKSNFLMSMSHELRTPLNAILGFSEIIKDQRFGQLGDSRYGDYAVEIHRAGAQLLQSVEDILDMTRLESGQMRLQIEPADPAHILAGVAQEVARKASESAIHVKVIPAGFTQPIMVDSRRLRQVLRNLLDNALKFSKPNSEVELSVQPAGRDGIVEFRVADTGAGMSPEQIPESSIPFGAKRNVLTQQVAGLGLGLPLSQRLAKLMGAELHIESALGRGTIVHLRLRQDGQPVAG